jgi:hypothetical protein
VIASSIAGFKELKSLFVDASADGSAGIEVVLLLVENGSIIYEIKVS